MSFWNGVFVVSVLIAYYMQRSILTREVVVIAEPSPNCDPNEIYYSFDGSCNNLINPTWGQAETDFHRLGQANYSYTKGSECLLSHPMIERALAHSRNIKKLVDSKKFPHNYNYVYFAFKEWSDSDIGTFKLVTNDCCKATCCKKAAGIDFQFEKNCLPMITSKLNSFYSKLNASCIDILRVYGSSFWHQNTGNLPSESCSPINFQTAYLDLSILYGSDSNGVDKMRLFKHGMLKCPDDGSPTIQNNYQSIFSTISFIKNCNKHEGDCSKIDFGKKDQNPELMLMGALFRKVHNILASYLMKLHRDDETIFQETRRYLIAAYQHIIFNEYIPATIGLDTARIYDLLSQDQLTHVPELNPQPSVEYIFASRYFTRKLFNSRYENAIGKNSSSHHHKKVYHLECDSKHDLSILIRTIMNLKRRALYNQKEPYVHKEKISRILEDFYSISDRNYGTDLLPVDILRGLDVGLPTYNEIRKELNYHQYVSFEELKLAVKGDESIRVLKKLYASVDDIDLYVGGLLEKSSSFHPTVGPTFVGIFKDTFYRLKFGDRLHYAFPTAKFTQEELKEIRKVTFSYLICLAEPDKKIFIASNAFLKPSSQKNPMYPCHYILKRGPKLS